MDKAMGKAKEAYGALTGDEPSRPRAEPSSARPRPRPGKRRRSATGKGSRTRAPWAASPMRRRAWAASRTS
jgi:hypothetical protein